MGLWFAGSVTQSTPHMNGEPDTIQGHQPGFGAQEQSVKISVRCVEGNNDAKITQHRQDGKTRSNAQMVDCAMGLYLLRPEGSQTSPGRE